ncbi:glycoside hydrolase family 97 C-terminal domain-containing protein [Bacteroides intestinalis]
MGEGEYRAEVYTDAPDAERNPNHLSKEIRTVTRKDKIELPLAVDGGAVLRISKL